MPRPDHLLRGDEAEGHARRFLESRGLLCVDANVRSRFGEIDLVMRDRETIVFVEVRYRRPTRFVDALDSVGPAKRRKLVATASWYLARRPRLAEAPVRFDVVAIDGRSPGRNALQWIVDAFRPGD